MKNQFGRSMVEMLGVLGVIGLLSIAGIEGYQYAVLRHRSNVVLKMAHQIGFECQVATHGLTTQVFKSLYQIGFEWYFLLI